MGTLAQLGHMVSEFFDEKDLELKQVGRHFDPLRTFIVVPSDSKKLFYVTRAY